jgi:hypothetical protein
LKFQIGGKSNQNMSFVQVFRLKSADSSYFCVTLHPTKQLQNDEIFSFPFFIIIYGYASSSPAER